MGVAEVSLVFDNDGTLPVDFQEVTITRRLFRNGDSEFYINRARCRLKDITNLFADTGIGHDSMGIISQNKIDDVLNARPEERRLFFEEAAGITKYRNRKRESMRKLEDTESNLLRVQDIIGEIENQLEPLKLSAEKTEKYNALQEELKKFNLAGIYLNYLDLNKKKAKHTAAITAKKDQEIAARTALQLSENRKEQFDKAVLELEKEQEAISQKRNELQSQLEAAESDIKVLEECYDLKKLILNNNMLDDLSPLANCALLEHLALKNTLVSNLSPISNCTHLKYLDLWGTRVTELFDIYNLKELKYLCVKNTDLRPAQIEDFKKHVPGCVVEE